MPLIDSSTSPAYGNPSGGDDDSVTLMAVLLIADPRAGQQLETKHVPITVRRA
jgi:hypothetical protein